MNTDINKVAQGVLSLHPRVNEVFATEDGNIFFDRNHAFDHNRSLKGTVTVITRQTKEVEKSKDPEIPVDENQMEETKDPEKPKDSKKQSGKPSKK